MATIRTRKQADGSTRYTAIVRLRRGKTPVHQEARTFAHRSAALTWAKHREVVLEDPSALVRVQPGAPTVAEVIRWYIDNFETVSKWQRSKQAHLEFLQRNALGKLNALTLKVAELLDHVRSRRDSAGPATVANVRHARNFASPGRPATHSAIASERPMCERRTCAQLPVSGTSRHQREYKAGRGRPARAKARNSSWLSFDAAA
jgi:hypothetical protein